MAQGWEELRLGLDGRWQPTGQLRDHFPFSETPTTVQVVEQRAPQVFHAIDARDVYDVDRHIFINGPMPEGRERVGALGWARFVRN